MKYLVVFFLIYTFGFAENKIEFFIQNSSAETSESGAASFSQYDKLTGKTSSGSTTLSDKGPDLNIELYQVKYLHDINYFSAIGFSTGYVKSSSQDYKRFSVEGVPLFLTLNLNAEYFNSILEIGTDLGVGTTFPIQSGFYEPLEVKKGFSGEIALYTKVKYKNLYAKLYFPSITWIDFNIKQKNRLENSSSITDVKDDYTLSSTIYTAKLGVGYDF